MLATDWRQLDQRIEAVSSEIEALAEDDAPCQRLMTVPGIGPIISSATVAAIGMGDDFSNVATFIGRRFRSPLIHRSLVLADRLRQPTLVRATMNEEPTPE